MATINQIILKKGEKKEVIVEYDDPHNVVKYAGFVYYDSEGTKHYIVAKEVKKEESHFRLRDRIIPNISNKNLIIELDIIEPFQGIREYRVALFSDKNNLDQNVKAISESSCNFITELDLNLKITKPWPSTKEKLTFKEIGVDKKYDFDYSINKNSKWIKTEKIRIKWVVSKGKIKNIEEENPDLIIFEGEITEKSSLRDLGICDIGEYTITIVVIATNECILEQDYVFINVVQEVDIKLKLDNITYSNTNTIEVGNNNLLNVILEDPNKICKKIIYNYNNGVVFLEENVENNVLRLNFLNGWKGKKDLDIFCYDKKNEVIAEFNFGLKFIVEIKKRGISLISINSKSNKDNLYEVNPGVENMFVVEINDKTPVLEFGCIRNEKKYLVERFKLANETNLFTFFLRFDLGLPYLSEWKTGDILEFYLVGLISEAGNEITNTVHFYLKKSEEIAFISFTNYNTFVNKTKEGNTLDFEYNKQDPENIIVDVVMWYGILEEKKSEELNKETFRPGKRVDLMALESKQLLIDFSNDFYVVVVGYNKEGLVVANDQLYFEVEGINSIKFLNVENGKISIADGNALSFGLEYEGRNIDRITVELEGSNWINEVEIKEDKGVIAILYDKQITNEEVFIARCLDKNGNLLAQDKVRVVLAESSSEDTDIIIEQINNKNYENKVILLNESEKDTFILKVINKLKRIDSLVISYSKDEAEVKYGELSFNKDLNIQRISFDINLNFWWYGEKNFFISGLDPDKTIILRKEIKLILPEMGVTLLALMKKKAKRDEKYNVYRLEENRFVYKIKNQKNMIEYFAIGILTEEGKTIFLKKYAVNSVKSGKFIDENFIFPEKHLWQGEIEFFVVGLDKNNEQIGQYFTFYLQRPILDYERLSEELKNFVDERKGDLNFFIKRHVIEESNILDNFINKKLNKNRKNILSYLSEMDFELSGNEYFILLNATLNRLKGIKWDENTEALKDRRIFLNELAVGLFRELYNIYIDWLKKRNLNYQNFILFLNKEKIDKENIVNYIYNDYNFVLNEDDYINVIMNAFNMILNHYRPESTFTY
ncbi:hypothetical protein J4436_02680 [Candidatus Woesearchaeota archaeon]|nr:hypothetical protein [Candidatus Woesearchaeota archaeon]